MIVKINVKNLVLQETTIKLVVMIARKIAKRSARAVALTAARK